MKYLKTYKNIFEDFNKSKAYQHEYSIYDFYNDIRKKELPENIELWSDHFIGKGWYKKIENKSKNMLEILSDIDLDLIEDRLVDLFDNYIEVNHEVYTSIAYGNFIDSDKDNDFLYTGTITSKSKDYITSHILSSIVYPTILTTELRGTKDEIYVKDEKWQLQNIDISKLSGFDSLVRHQKRDLSKYNIDTIFDLYKPSINILLGEGISSTRQRSNRSKFILSDVEDLFSEFIPYVIRDLEESGNKVFDVVYPYLKGRRKYGDNIDITEYSVKILLDI